MRQRIREESRAKSGFTIIELLVATAVTTVLVGMMIMMTSGVLTAWNRTSGTLSANNQAQLILDQVAQDLQASLFRFDPSNPEAVWLAVEVLDQWPSGGGHTLTNLRDDREWVTVAPAEPQSVIIKPIRTQSPLSYRLEELDLADCRYGVGGAWLRFFSNGTQGQNTAPTVVSYQIIRRHVTTTNPPVTPNPAEIRYMLYRSEIGGWEGPLRYGYDLAGTSSGPGPGIGSPNPSPARHYADSTHSGGLINPRNSDIIGNNVIDFGVRLYTREGGVLDPLYPANPVTLEFDNNFPRYLADGSTSPSPGGGPGTIRGPFPDVADIMVRVLTDEGARQIQNLEARLTYPNVTDVNQRRELWWEIAEANSRVFTRRVFLNQKRY